VYLPTNVRHSKHREKLDKTEGGDKRWAEITTIVASEPGIYVGNKERVRWRGRSSPVSPRSK
jgi:hypothetical protein